MFFCSFEKRLVIDSFYFDYKKRKLIAGVIYMVQLEMIRLKTVFVNKNVFAITPNLLYAVKLDVSYIYQELL